MPICRPHSAAPKAVIQMRARTRKREVGSDENDGADPELQMPIDAIGKNAERIGCCGIDRVHDHQYDRYEGRIDCQRHALSAPGTPG